MSRNAFVFHDWTVGGREEERNDGPRMILSFPFEVFRVRRDERHH